MGKGRSPPPPPPPLLKTCGIHEIYTKILLFKNSIAKLWRIKK